MPDPTDTRALTLYPEHALAFALGIRGIETRGWATSWRGELLIHAGARDPDSAAARRDPISQRVIAALPDGDPIPTRAVVAVARLADVVPIVEDYEDLCHTYEGPAAVEVGTLAVGGQWLYRYPQWNIPLDEDDIIDISDQLPYGDFTPGRWAWLLNDIRPLDPPVSEYQARPLIGPREPIATPVRGRQGLWRPDPELVEACHA